MTQNTVFGIGYQGRDPATFVGELAAVGVGVLVDVRLTPISRKRGFSRTALSGLLADAGIGYLHLRELGNPKDNRKAFHTGDLQAGRATYRDLLLTGAAQVALGRVAELATTTVVALLCFEADVEHCHRQVVLSDLATRESGLVSVDL